MIYDRHLSCKVNGISPTFWAKKGYYVETIGNITDDNSKVYKEQTEEDPVERRFEVVPL